MRLLNPIVNLTEFMSEPVQFMRDMDHQGEPQCLLLGPKRFVFVFDPERAQEILIKRADIYVQNRTVFDRIQPVTGKKGLVQLSGKESQAGRLKSRSMFNGAGLDTARVIIEDYCDEFLRKAATQNKIDVTAEMTSLILQTALTIFLGVRSPELASKIGEKFLRLNYLCGLRMRSLAPAHLFIPTRKNREIICLQKEIRVMLEKHLQRESGVPKAFDGDENLIDHCMTFLFAGHETTAASLAFTLLLLAQNPKYQDQIAQGDEAATMAVYKESLRLFPPAYMLARQATRDDDLLGCSVRKADQVLIGITEMHRSPDLFPDPGQFRPERFAEKLKHPLSFIPFGAGGKSCVGERLAYFEAAIVLKKICQKFKISSPSAPLQAEPLITLHPLPNQYIFLHSRAGEIHD
ncbi:cytochrome P450 [Bdellovibrio sp. HCB117]|uniref:cytochrome P450 n=1 Tax=Bdellovibrio sp. HCB117 TaxID=3394359 RepID=UPI0039B39816